MARLIINEIAEKQGINRSQLQMRAGVTLSMLNRYWLNKTESVDLACLDRIASVLGVQVRDLFAVEEPQSVEKAESQ